MQLDSENVSNVRNIVLVSCLAALAAVPANAQLQLATIRGIVLETGGQPVAAVSIELADPLGGVLRAQLSDAAGRFAFVAVAPGRYTLRARPDGFAPLVEAVNIDTAVTQEVILRLSLRTAVAVTVDDSARLDSPTTRASIAGESLERVPVRSLTRGVQDAIATLPGWSTEDNGLLHARGTDDGFLYVIDGVPVYERLDQLSGIAPQLGTIESINVITGYVPAEFGYKAGGVIDVRSKSGTGDWAGTAQIGRGSEDDTTGMVSIGGQVARTVTVSAGFAAQQSDRFLDPVHPDNLHNRGGAASGAGQLTWARSTHIVSASLGFGRMEYDVPNTAEQEHAGQDQRQRIEQDYGSVSWQRAWSTALFSQMSIYLRRSVARLDGSAQDMPLFAQADRSLSRFGAIAAITRQAGRHTLKAGVEIQRLALDESFLFGVTDEEAAEDAGLSDEAIEHTVRDPFSFFGRATPTMRSAFAQNEWAATAKATISAGIRFDDSRLLLHRRQLNPRVGVAYRVTDGTVLRGSASRFFQPPQPENLLLSSSAQARELSPFAEHGGEGGADVEPERQWAFEAGINHRAGRFFRIDAAFWYRRISEAADPNVFAGTTMIFPNAVAVGRARGLDLLLEMTRRGSWSGYLNGSMGRVRQRGPITGGLFLEDDVGDVASGEEFVPDHDQLLVAGGGLTWTHERSGAAVAATIRHESGTPIGRETEDEDELRARPGAELVDFDRGRVGPRTVASLQADLPVWKRGRRMTSIRASVLNLFNDRYAYNFGNPFSGTHFGAPRTASLAIRLRF